MKVDGLTKEQLDAELKKTLKVQALGESDIYVGYYNHLRRRGGDIFLLRPIIRERLDKVTKKVFKVLITAEMQFSERWMQKVAATLPTNMPKHFNEAGRGKKRLDVPGMTRKIGGDEQSAMDAHDSMEGTGEYVAPVVVPGSVDTGNVAVEGEVQI